LIQLQQTTLELSRHRLQLLQRLWSIDAPRSLVLLPLRPSLRLHLRLPSLQLPHLLDLSLLISLLHPPLLSCRWRIRRDVQIREQIMRKRHSCERDGYDGHSRRHNRSCARSNVKFDIVEIPIEEVVIVICIAIRINDSGNNGSCITLAGSGNNGAIRGSSSIIVVRFQLDLLKRTLSSPSWSQ
jgi:hypothetical protein